MNRKTLVLITGALLTCAVNGQGETIPDKLDINLQQSNPALATKWQDSKSVKGFNHQAHITILKQDDGQNVCQTCHTEVTHAEVMLSAERSIKQLEAVEAAGSVKKYMHGQCVACHKTLKKQHKPTGPTSCKGCH